MERNRREGKGELQGKGDGKSRKGSQWKVICEKKKKVNRWITIENTDEREIKVNCKKSSKKESSFANGVR